MLPSCQTLRAPIVTELLKHGSVSIAGSRMLWNEFSWHITKAPESSMPKKENYQRRRLGATGLLGMVVELICRGRQVVAGKLRQSYLEYRPIGLEENWTSSARGHVYLGS